MREEPLDWAYSHALYLRSLDAAQPRKIPGYPYRPSLYLAALEFELRDLK